MVDKAHEQLKAGSDRKEKTHVAPIIDDARKVVGTYATDVHDEEEWDERSSTKRIDEFDERLKRGEYPTLLQLYDRNSDADRRQADRLYSKDERQKLKPEEQQELLATQLRISQRETIAKALDVYFQLLEMYREMKERGVAGESKDEDDVFSHLHLVRQAAAERLAIARQINDHPAERASLLVKGKQLDDALIRLLICQDPDIPGHNKDGLLPTHRLMLAALKKEYEGMMLQYRTIADGGYQKAKERADLAQKALEMAFPGKDPKTLTVEEVEPVLRSVGYASLQAYTIDVAAVKSKALVFDKIKGEGKKNVDTLANLTAALALFQAKRSELSTIRHHFDQGYSLDAHGAPIPGGTPVKSVEELRGIFAKEQQGSLGSLEHHLQRVEDGVLKIGLPEKAEALWNEKGRVFMSRIAQRVAELETAWIPDVPGIEHKTFLRDSAREYLLHENPDGSLDGSLYDALGWPRDPVTSQPKSWKDLSSQEVKALEDKQKSSETAIKEFEKKGSFQKMKTSVQAAKAIINRKDLQAENFLGNTEIDEATLPAEVVTAGNLDVLIGKYTAPVVIKMCFVQLQANAESYGEDYKKLLNDFHEVVGIHLDVQRYFNDFAKKQFEITVSMILAALLAILGGGAALSIGWKLGGMTLRAGGRGLRGTARATGKVLGKTRDALGNLAKGTGSGLKTGEAAVETAGESMKAFDKLQEEIRAARGAKDNKKVIELLKASEKLIEQQAKAGNPGAKGMLAILRVLKVPTWAGSAFKFIGPVVDAVLLGVNEWELFDARGDKNFGLQQTLESKRKVLAAQGGVGLTMLLGFSGPQAIAVAPFAVATAIYTSKVFDGAAQWDRNWMKETPEQLKIELEKVTYGHTTVAHSAAVGSNEFERPFTQWGKAPKDIEEGELRQIENINASMRESILSAYFLKTMKVAPKLPSETDNQFRDRIGLMLRDRINYVRRLTGGTYVYSVTNDRLFYDFAHHYGDLMGVRRTLEDQSLPTVLQYEYDGKDKTLDLAPLKFVSATGKPNEADQMKFLTLLSRYDTELSPQIEMARAVRKEIGKK